PLGPPGRRRPPGPGCDSNHWEVGMRHPALLAAGLVALTVAAASCTGSGNGDGSGRGPITLVRGKDTTGKLARLLHRRDTLHPNERVHLVELPEKADDQRSLLAQNAQARSHLFDVLALDIVWTPEFAARGWIVSLDGAGIDTSRLLRQAVGTGVYQGHRYS